MLTYEQSLKEIFPQPIVWDYVCANNKALASICALFNLESGVAVPVDRHSFYEKLFTIKNSMTPLGDAAMNAALSYTSPDNSFSKTVTSSGDMTGFVEMHRRFWETRPAHFYQATKVFVEQRLKKPTPASL